MAKYLAAKASWEAANVCLQTHGGFGFANEYDVERKFRETRLYQVAPISTNLILSYVAEHVLGLPRSLRDGSVHRHLREHRCRARRAPARRHHRGVPRTGDRRAARARATWPTAAPASSRSSAPATATSRATTTRAERPVVATSPGPTGRRKASTSTSRMPEGRRVLTPLLARADVFVQNLAPGAAARLGLDRGARPRHPRMVCCDVSGYGTDGPYRDRKAYDLLVQARPA